MNNESPYPLSKLPLIEERYESRSNHFESFPQEENKSETHWQKRDKYRAARVIEETVSMEIKTLLVVRESIKALAAEEGLSTQKYIELLIISALNKNSQLIAAGYERIERFNGNVIAARQNALDEKLSRLESLQTSLRARGSLTDELSADI